MYAHLDYSQDELAAAMSDAYSAIIDFVTTDEFTSLMNEFSRLESTQRPLFVANVLLDDQALLDRGVSVPEGILIQRSAFGDRRPTLFVVKKFLPERFSDVWQNVNITVDDLFDDASVSREPTTAWRQPLPVARQAQLMAEGRDLEELEPIGATVS